MPKFLLYCEYCNFKKITDDNDIPDGMHQIKTSPIPGGVIKTDGKKKFGGKSKEQPKKIRCPGCGKLLIFKKMAFDPQSKLDDEKEQKRRKSESQFDGS